MDYYDELRCWGRQGMSGAHPIVWADAGEWRREMRYTIRPDEWRLLMQIDTRFRIAAKKNTPEPKGSRGR